MQAELTFRSYKPLKLEKGMWFINKINPNTFKETINITILNSIPQDEEEFLQINGYPVEPYIVSDNHVLATPQQIAWFDEDPDAEFMSDVTIEQLTLILNEYDGWLEIQMEDCEGDDDECQSTPVIMEGKVIISYLMEEEEYEEYVYECPLCEGTGETEDGGVCPECEGEGIVEDESDFDDDSDFEEDIEIDWEIDNIENSDNDGEDKN